MVCKSDRLVGGETVDRGLIRDHFTDFGTKQEEGTSSSPSGRHYGHMRLCATDAEVNAVIFDVMDLAYRNNVILHRWRVVQDILLRKDPTGSRIHRMRNIMIVEGDLQYLMKEVWARRLMTSADPLLIDSQNAKKQKVAQSAVLNHRLGMDLTLAKHSEAIIVVNDAVNCYDRIILEVAALASMRMGMTIACSIFFINLLRSVKHFLVLGSLVTEGFVQSSKSEPLDGTGQGAGWSPVTWMTVFDIVLTAVRKFQPGVLYRSPDKTVEDRRDAEGYVDDSNQGVNSEGVEKYNEERGSEMTIGEAALKANQAFERYLSLTGGKLAIEKTVIYGLGTELKGTRVEFVSREQDPPFILNENYGEEKVKVRQLPPTKAHKMLGILVAPVEDVGAQLKKMETAVRDWKATMKDPRLNAADVRLSYECHICPRLYYGLVTNRATERQLDRIQQLMMPEFKHTFKLPVTTANRKMRIPKSYGGYGMDDIFLERVGIQTAFAIQHIRNNDSVGRRFRILLAQHQLQSGISRSVLEKRGRPGYLSVSWAVSLLDDLDRCGLELSMEIPGKHPEERTIMDVLTEAGLGKEKLEKINMCRMALKLVTITDARSCDSRGMMESILKGKNWRGSKWEWPKTRIPGKWWGLWRSAMIEYVGPWVRVTEAPSDHQVITSRTAEGAKYISYKDELYERQGRSGRRSKYTRGENKTIDLPLQCDIEECPGGITLKTLGQELPEREERRAEDESQVPTRRKTLAEMIDEQEEGCQKRVAGLPVNEEEAREIAEYMRTGVLVAASDGLTWGSRNAFGLCLGVSPEPRLWGTANEVEGHPVASDRSELAGILALVEYLSIVAEWAGVDPNLKIYSDNMYSVDFAKNPRMGKTPQWSDRRNFDLKLELARRLKSTRLKIEFEHVRGHQDKEKTYEELPFEAKMNFHCDAMAKKEVKGLQNETRRTIQFRPESVGVMVKDSDGFLTERVKGYLYRNEYYEEVMDLIRVGPVEMRNIDWEALQSVLKKQNWATSIYRLMWGDNPTKARLFQQGRTYSLECPLCGKKDVVDHFLECEKVTGTVQWEEIKMQLQTRAGELKILGSLVKVVLTTLEGGDVNVEVRIGLHRKLFKGQKDIGWRNLLKGRVHREWHQLQKREPGIDHLAPTAWNYGLVGFCLESLKRRWKLRCTMVAEADGEKEREHLIAEYEEMTEKEGWRDLHKMDEYLREEKHRPGNNMTLEVLRELVRTCRMAVRANRT